MTASSRLASPPRCPTRGFCRTLAGREPRRSGGRTCGSHRPHRRWARRRSAAATPRWASQRGVAGPAWHLRKTTVAPWPGVVGALVRPRAQGRTPKGGAPRRRAARTTASRPSQRQVRGEGGHSLCQRCQTQRTGQHDAAAAPRNLTVLVGAGQPALLARRVWHEEAREASRLRPQRRPARARPHRVSALACCDGLLERRRTCGSGEASRNSEASKMRVLRRFRRTCRTPQAYHCLVMCVYQSLQR